MRLTVALAVLVGLAVWVPGVEAKPQKLTTAAATRAIYRDGIGLRSVDGCERISRRRVGCWLWSYDDYGEWMGAWAEAARSRGRVLVSFPN